MGARKLPLWRTLHRSAPLNNGTILGAICAYIFLREEEAECYSILTPFVASRLSLPREWAVVYWRYAAPDLDLEKGEPKNGFVAFGDAFFASSVWEKLRHEFIPPWQDWWEEMAGMDLLAPGNGDCARWQVHTDEEGDFICLHPINPGCWGIYPRKMRA